VVRQWYQHLSWAHN